MKNADIGTLQLLMRTKKGLQLFTEVLPSETGIAGFEPTDDGVRVLIPFA